MSVGKYNVSIVGRGKALTGEDDSIESLFSNAIVSLEGVGHTVNTLSFKIIKKETDEGDDFDYGVGVSGNGETHTGDNDDIAVLLAVFITQLENNGHVITEKTVKYLDDI